MVIGVVVRVHPGMLVVLVRVALHVDGIVLHQKVVCARIVADSLIALAGRRVVLLARLTALSQIGLVVLVDPLASRAN